MQIYAKKEPRDEVSGLKNGGGFSRSLNPEHRSYARRSLSEPYTDGSFIYSPSLWESNGSHLFFFFLRYAKEEPRDEVSGLKNGGYLLSHKCSTIGDAELNDPVRNGKGWDLSAITT